MIPPPSILPAHFVFHQAACSMFHFHYLIMNIVFSLSKNIDRVILLLHTYTYSPIHLSWDFFSGDKTVWSISRAIVPFRYDLLSPRLGQFSGIGKRKGALTTRIPAVRIFIHGDPLPVRLNTPRAGRYFRIKWPGVSCRGIWSASGREARAPAAGLYVGSCTSAKFVIDTVKADRAGHYADQEIRIPPRVASRRSEEKETSKGMDLLRRGD